jgi:5-(carboxyamino)imidazole ribonucleotide mutase
MVQMPGGVPVGVLAVGKAGAVNAAILATQILARSRPELREALVGHRAAQASKILSTPDPSAGG